MFSRAFYLCVGISGESVGDDNVGGEDDLDALRGSRLLQLARLGVASSIGEHQAKRIKKKNAYIRCGYLLIKPFGHFVDTLWILCGYLTLWVP